MKKLFLITGLAITLFACNVLKPIQKDEAAKSMLTEIQNVVNFLYTEPTFIQEEYDLLNGKISNLIAYNELRPNLQAIVSNVKELQKLVLSIEARHKARGNLNATLQNLYKQQITDKITDIFTAENKLK